MSKSSDRQIGVLATTRDSSEVDKEPSWTRGEIVGRPLWPFLGGLAALITSFSRVPSHVPNLLLPFLIALSIVGIFSLAVALERCQSVKWDERGVTFSFLGRPTRSIAWKHVVSLDKERRIWLKSGKQVRLLSMFASGVQAGALLETAVIIHASLWNQIKVATRARPGTTNDAVSKSNGKQIQNNIWRRIVADLARPNAPAWETAPAPGLYVYKTFGYRIQATVGALGWIGFFGAKDVIVDAIKHPGWAAVAECLLLFAMGGFVIAVLATYHKLLKVSGIRVEDTVEVSGEGLRICREGKPTPWLQYPRHVMTRKSKWLPSSSYHTWSNGEEQHAVDPRFLVRLQDDLPPEFAYAATEGGGWLNRPEQLTADPPVPALGTPMVSEDYATEPLLAEGTIATTDARELT